MTDTQTSFEDLGLNDDLMKALKSVGYEVPSPIQAESIPPLLQGRDILGQAQTGTGKTAAFALPLLQQVDTRVKSPQILVLAPTRELAIQVSEAFQRYAHYIPGFHVLPVYGGQGYDTQIRALKRGVHVIVGTPGRVMDHMRKGTLKLDNIKHLVLDEADEMLRMGFIDDVKWVLTQLPEKRQIALFSATMPREVAKVANTYLNDPVHIKIKVATTTAALITQQYWPVAGVHKLDALTRILEMETFDAMIVFVRTKTATVELAEKLQARGYASAALNGDISQNVRERTVEKLKNGKIDVLVATDVAARGLDVERISHVLNYDIPYDTEAYIHRIGRTGRAGREGKAILFVAKRETRLLKAIEKATGQRIDVIELPSTQDINKKRIDEFKQRIIATMEHANTKFFSRLVEEIHQETEKGFTEIAAALAQIAQGEQPIVLKENAKTNDSYSKKDRFREDSDRPGRSDRKDRDRPRDRKDGDKPRRNKVADDANMKTYRIEVGRNDNVNPGNIVGAIANEAGIDSQYIGHIKIHDDYSTIDLPSDMPKEVFSSLRRVWVCQKQLNISLADGAANPKDSKVSDSKPSRSKPSNSEPSDSKPLKKPSTKKKMGGSKTIGKKKKTNDKDAKKSTKAPRKSKVSKPS